MVGYQDAKNIHLKAEGGLGKTALMSGLAKICAEAQMKTILCYGGTNGCQDYHTFKKYVTYQLETCLDEAHQEITDSLNERLIELDQKVAQDFKVICFLDAIDQIFDSNEIRIDLLDLCPNIIFVISSVNEISLINDNIKCLEIDGLTDEQISGMIMNTTAQRGKTLNREIIQKITERDNAKNPLYLSNLLQRLFMMSAGEFELAESLAPGIEGIHQYMHQILELVPDDQFDLISYLMKETAKYFQNVEFQQIISLIDASKDGLTENELRDILALKGIQFNSLLFSQIVTYLYDVFIRKNNGKWAFKHRLFRKAIKDEDNSLDLLCRYALINDDFLEKEGLYYLTENRHENGYLIYEKGNIENMQAFIVRLLKKDDSYQEYFIKIAEKAECNICFENVCRLNHETLNRMQETILDKLYASEHLSPENQLQYWRHKISLCRFYNQTYLDCLEQIKSLDEAFYYYEISSYRFHNGAAGEAEEMIQKAISLAEQKKKSEESIVKLCNYVRKQIEFVTKHRTFDPLKLEVYMKLLQEYSKEPLSKAYRLETLLYSELSILYTQKKYYDAKKVTEYRDEAVKRAKSLIEKLPSVENLYLILDVYANAQKTVKDEQRYRYLEECVKYSQRKYELTRQDEDLYHLAYELTLYAEHRTNEDEVIKLYEQAIRYFEDLYRKNAELAPVCKKRYLYAKADLALYMKKSENWENRKKGYSLLEAVAADASFGQLKQQKKLEYPDILMEYWIHNSSTRSQALKASCSIAYARLFPAIHEQCLT